MSKIIDKTVLVTGANRGIGRAFVNVLLETGANKIYASARNPETLNDLVASGGGKVIAIKIDVTKPENINEAAAELKDVDLLINNAGVATFEGIISAENDHAARLEMETNYFGTFNLIRAFAPILKDNGGGAIINMASIASYVNFPALGSYCASKAAVHSLTQGVRAELEAQGTLVTGVYPGPIDTDMAVNFPMDKTPTATAVKNILDAVDKGIEDIYPDVVSETMFAQFLSDPKILEKEAGSMRPE